MRESNYFVPLLDTYKSMAHYFVNWSLAFHISINQRWLFLLRTTCFHILISFTTHSGLLFRARSSNYLIFNYIFHIGICPTTKLINIAYLLWFRMWDKQSLQAASMYLYSSAGLSLKLPRFPICWIMKDHCFGWSKLSRELLRR